MISNEIMTVVIKIFFTEMISQQMPGLPGGIHDCNGLNCVGEICLGPLQVSRRGLCFERGSRFRFILKGWIGWILEGP